MKQPDDPENLLKLRKDDEEYYSWIKTRYDYASLPQFDQKEIHSFDDVDFNVENVQDVRPVIALCRSIWKHAIAVRISPEIEKEFSTYKRSDATAKTRVTLDILKAIRDDIITLGSKYIRMDRKLYEKHLFVNFPIYYSRDYIMSDEWHPLSFPDYGTVGTLHKENKAQLVEFYESCVYWLNEFKYSDVPIVGGPSESRVFSDGYWNRTRYYLDTSNIPEPRTEGYQIYGSWPSPDYGTGWCSQQLNYVHDNQPYEYNCSGDVPNGWYSRTWNEWDGLYPESHTESVSSFVSPVVVSMYRRYTYDAMYFPGSAQAYETFEISPEYITARGRIKGPDIYPVVDYSVYATFSTHASGCAHDEQFLEYFVNMDKPNVTNRSPVGIDAIIFVPNGPDNGSAWNADDFITGREIGNNQFIKNASLPASSSIDDETYISNINRNYKDIRYDNFGCRIERLYDGFEKRDNFYPIGKATLRAREVETDTQGGLGGLIDSMNIFSLEYTGPYYTEMLFPKKMTYRTYRQVLGESSPVVTDMEIDVSYHTVGSDLFSSLSLTLTGDYEINRYISPIYIRDELTEQINETKESSTYELPCDRYGYIWEDRSDVVGYREMHRIANFVNVEGIVTPYDPSLALLSKETIVNEMAEYEEFLGPDYFRIDEKIPAGENRVLDFTFPDKDPDNFKPEDKNPPLATAEKQRFVGEIKHSLKLRLVADFSKSLSTF